MPMSGSKIEIRAITKELEEIFGAIIKHPAFIKQSGSLPDDPAHQSDKADIASLLQRMDRLVSRIGGKIGSFDWQHQMARRYPREERYRAQQSVRDRSAPYRELYEKSVQMLDSLLKLQANNNKVSFIDALGAAHETAQSNVEQFKKLDELTAKMQSAGLTSSVQTISAADHHIAKLNADPAGAYNIPLNVVLALVVVIAAAAHWRKGSFPGQT